MRGLTGLLYETSKLHPVNGITYRGKDLNEIIKQSPRASGGTQPTPEGVLWLLLTGVYPNQEEVKTFQEELYQRSHLSDETETLIRNLPEKMHPMTKFSIGVMSCQPDSNFAKAYHKGVPKKEYWEHTLEDSLDICAKVIQLAAVVYNSTYNRGKQLPGPDQDLDMSANLVQMMGFSDKSFYDLMRLYLVIHADHEGGTVSSHTAHCVNSALSDPYLAYSAAMNGLAGPLHGLANQESLNFLLDFEKRFGHIWTDNDIANYVEEILSESRVIPGYGHAVLRKTDPRFIHLLEFAEKNIEENNLIRLLNQCYTVIPKILDKHKKIKNPWPNVDAGSGVMLLHYGLNHQDFYTVLFGVSRALGIMSSLVWSRAFNLPIERPNSITLDLLLEKVSSGK
ncbi:citrate synthase [Stylonychia lemnae]|uniref:Citrate synthase n=1 Tax=Stylonychia lemnae TaxID=5949 RepID=A0A078A974_STYLE|nr:citrate synthase [Stylonychia lemnae]|eukprot:CDW78122.1 citrate synthase [Stylonychia lemnae]